MEGEEVYACNMCKVRFNTVDKIRKYIEKEQKEVIVQISKAIHKEDGSKSESNSSDEVMVMPCWQTLTKMETSCK